MQLLCIFPVSFRLVLVSFSTGLVPVKSGAGPQCGIPRTVLSQWKAQSALLIAWPHFALMPGERELCSHLLSLIASHAHPTVTSAVGIPSKELSIGYLSWMEDTLFLRDPPAGNHYIQLHCPWDGTGPPPTVVIAHHGVSSSHWGAELLHSGLRSSVIYFQRLGSLHHPALTSITLIS